MIRCLAIHKVPKNNHTAQYCSTVSYKWADNFDDVCRHPDAYTGCGASNWGGSDTIDRTLEKDKLRLTGKKIALSKPFEVEGCDDDCGHKYSWHHTITELYEVEEIPEPKPKFNLTDDEIKHCIFHLKITPYGYPNFVKHDYVADNLKKNGVKFARVNNSFGHNGYYFTGENPDGVRKFVKWAFTDNYLDTKQHADGNLLCCTPSLNG